MSELTTNSILALFETTKEQRASFVRQVVSTVADGGEDPLKVHLQIKCMEEIIKAILADPDYRRSVLDQGEKHGKRFIYRNSEMNIMETGVSYDYENCGDPELLRLIEQMEGLKVRVKGRQDFLKTLPAEGMTYIDEDTGEIKKIYPPVKSSTTTVSVKLK